MSRFLLEADERRGWFVHGDKLSGSLYLAQGSEGALRCFFREVEMRARPGNPRCFVLEDLAARRVQVIGFPGDTGHLQVSMDATAMGTRFCVQAAAADEMADAISEDSAPAAALPGAAWERGQAVFALEMFTREGAFLSLCWPGTDAAAAAAAAAAVAAPHAEKLASPSDAEADTASATPSGALGDDETASSAAAVPASGLLAAAGAAAAGDAKHSEPRPVIVASGVRGGAPPLLLRATRMQGAVLPPLIVPEWRDAERPCNHRRASAPSATSSGRADGGAGSSAGSGSAVPPPAAAGKAEAAEGAWELLDAKRLPGPEPLQRGSARGMLGHRSFYQRHAASRSTRSSSSSSSSVLESLLAVGTGVSKAAMDFGQSLVKAPRAAPSRVEQGKPSHWPPKPRKSGD